MATWNLDKAHSEISFKVKHMMISNVTGSFKDFDITLQAEKEDFTDAKISFVAQTKSIDTKNEQRDRHLVSADFFDAEKFPEMTFVSTGLIKESDTDYVLEGSLTIKDKTQPIRLNVEFGGVFVDPWGVSKAGFTVSGKLKRSDFGLTWNAALESGGVLVSEEVKLMAELQFSRA